MSEIIQSQVTLGGPAPEGVTTGTNLLLPARTSTARLAHFPDEVYDLRAESHLVRFLKAMLGDAGAGQLRKRMVMSRLQQTLQGLRFHDLDRFYGALFGIRRTSGELLDVNPYTSTATSAEWAVQSAKDASYRSRVTQFARALSMGPTPTGAELAAEALLGVDVDVFESFAQADSGSRTYGEIEDLEIDTSTITNLVPNPSFETGVGTGWTVGATAGLTLETATFPEDGTAAHGSRYWRSTISAGVSSGTPYWINNYVDVVAGRTYAGSIWVRSSRACEVRTRTWWYSSVGVSAGASWFGENVTLAPGQWTRLDTVVQAPEGATLARFSVSTSTVGTFYARTNRVSDPRTAGTVRWGTGAAARALTGDGWLRMTTDASTAAYAYPQSGEASIYYGAPTGTRVATRVRVRNPDTVTRYVRLAFFQYTASAALGLVNNSAIVGLAPGEERLLEEIATVNHPDAVKVLPLLYLYGTSGGGVAPNGAIYDVKEWAAYTGDDAPGSGPVPYFHGDSQPGATIWSGTPDASMSVERHLLDIDAAIFHEGDGPREFFDGATTSDEGVVYAWVGADHASASTATYTGTTYESLEGMTYAELEGEGLPVLAGDERREYVVRPKRPISDGEAHELASTLRKIAPADARVVVDAHGSLPYGTVAIRGATADSEYWEVVPKVITRDIPGAPYQRTSPDAIEQPRPPFSAYQGEAWSHIGDVIGVAAFETTNPDEPTARRTVIAQRVTLPGGASLDYPARQALVPRRHLLAGRATSDGVLTAHPYWASSPRDTGQDLSPLFTDRIPLTALASLLSRHPADSFPQNPIERFWVSPERDQTDRTTEMLEISLAHPRRLNYVSVETARYPHRLTIQVFQESDWVTIGTHDVTESMPAFLPPGLLAPGHPQHSHAGHWQRVSLHLDRQYTTSSVRLLLQRLPGAVGPKANATDPVPYSLALRSLDVGYRVRSLADVPAEAMEGEVEIGSTIDPVGSRMEFHLMRQTADAVLTDDGAIWRSEPQPVNFAVVNLYLDVRTESGDAQVLDTIYLDPVYPGAHLSIYWTEDLGDPEGVEWYEQRVWRPVERDYRLQKGYVHLPPTYARHLKLEFTALAAEPHGNMLDLARPIRLFPQWLIDLYAHRGMMSDSALDSGTRTAIEVADDVRYADAVAALRRLSAGERDGLSYLPTEAMYAMDVEGMSRLAAESWAFGFTPWHQGSEAPRFPSVGRHEYQTIEMRHSTQVGFLVGLRQVLVLRTDPTADDDSLLYDETFHDFRNIEPGMTWTFEPGRIETVLESDCVATSRPHTSRHDVWALQFATQQTDPVQVVPDDDLRDPALATIDWSSNPEGWHRIGDATIVYSPLNHSARLVRYAQPPLRRTNLLPGLIQEPHHEVFSYRDVVTGDSTQTAESFGGIESPLVGVSNAGTVYGAIRLTFLSSLTSPLLFQVVDGTTDEPLLTHRITGNAGETIERHYPFPLGGSAAVKVRLIQQGVSNDQWEVDRMSLFDPGVRWEFSVNGGATWVAAEGVRNNAYGMVVFPEPGNQLVWRVTGMRPRMSVSMLRIRPHYLGAQNARFNGVQRGPNVSSFDAGVPITSDPLFTTWAGPIPRDWYTAYRQFPTLVSADGPTVTEFARFYGRPVETDLPAPTDTSVRSVAFARTVTDLAWPDASGPTFDTSDRKVWFYRSGADAVGAPTDVAYALVTPASTWGPHNIPVHRP